LRNKLQAYVLRFTDISLKPGKPVINFVLTFILSRVVWLSQQIIRCAIVVSLIYR
jgi:hypothetical protein